MPIEIMKKSTDPVRLREDITAFESVLANDPDNESAARMLAKRKAQLKALEEK
jgi:hypothetical protein